MEEIDYPELESIRIPDKTHFKIGEVAKLLDLEPYVLRYWEKEFDVLEPNKTDSGQRAYQRQDIELLATIQRLLYTEMFTIDGARRQLELAKKGEPSYLTETVASEADEAAAERLEEVQRENEKLRGRLEQREERVEQLQADLQAARAEVERLEAKTRELEREQTDGLDAEGRELLDDLHGEIDALANLADRGGHASA